MNSHFNDAAASRDSCSRATLDFDETSSSLLRRVRISDDGATWARLVERYEPLLLAYIRRRGLQEQDARDVVQDVFLRLYRSLATFQLDRDRGRFRTWLWQVATSALADWGRVRRRHDCIVQRMRDQSRESEPKFERVCDDSQLADQRRRLADALSAVRASSQQTTWACFERRLVRGQSSATVAAELGLTPAAVNVNTSRTLARVRQHCGTRAN